MTAYVVRHTTEGAREPVSAPFGDETSARAAWLALLGTPDLRWAAVERTNGDRAMRTRCEWSGGGAGFHDVTRDHWQATRELAARLTAAAPAGYSVTVVSRAGEREPGRWDVLFSGRATGTHRIGLDVSNEARVLAHWSGYLPATAARPPLYFDTPCGDPYTLRKLADANTGEGALEPEVFEGLLKLAAGQTYELNLGAGGVTTFTRLS